MSRIKELKTQPEHNINIIDLLVMVIPENKTKYVEMLIRMMKSTNNIEYYHNEVKTYLNKNINIPLEELEKIPPFQLTFVYKFFDSMFNTNDLIEFQKFCEYNERGLIQQNDLTKYKSFEDVLSQVSIADLKVNSKNLEKQIRKVFENDEWLIVRPLTYESSLKYGSNTKWCTTMKDEFSHFRKYASGILIYIINKVTGLKVACHKDGGELSFWDQKDSRIDSLASGLPFDILMEIKNEITINPSGNLSYLTIDEIKNEDGKYIREKTKTLSESLDRAVEFTQGVEQIADPGIQDREAILGRAETYHWGNDVAEMAPSEMPQSENILRRG